ncbi:MAG TPA: hypothetical protein VGL61_25355 [Kofleriaceae bacterium]
MFHPIHNWTDGFIAVRKRAISTRGAIELDDGPKWPRTTGDDVVLIAALFDPSVRASATAGLVRRWRSTLDAIERSALAAPSDTYGDNRAFWNTLEMAAVTLDDQAAPVPDSEVWHRLTDELGTRPRNASDEHYTLEDRTILRDGDAIMKLSRVDLGDERYAVAPYDFDHLARRIVRLLNGKRPRNARDPRIDALAVYVEMGRELRTKRGAVPAAEITGLATGNTQIPRLTNGDALRIAAFWGEWLADTPTDSGDELQARWRAALDDVAALAVPGDPDAAYPNTIELWRMCGAVAAHISETTETTKQNARNAGEADDDDDDRNDDDESDGDDDAPDDIDRNDPIESFIALRSEMLDARGCDERTASPDAGYAGAYAIPRTTLADVQRIAGDWSERLAGPLGTSGAMKAIGEVARATWRRARRHVDRAVKTADPDTVYEHNNEFWRALTVLAATLSAVYEVERTRPRNAPSSYGWLDQVMQRIDPLGIYVAFVQHYSAERGTDMLAPPPGFGGTTRLIPRTTNHDVLTIAAWCTDALADTPHIPGTTGDEITHWAAAVADVNAIAWRGDPDALYLHNNEFWRSLAQVVTLMSATDDVRYRRVPSALRNAPPPPFGPFPGITKYDEIYNAQTALLRKQRGADTLAPPAGFGGMTIPIPRTTNDDVTKLATWWDAVWTEAADQLANLADHASASATLQADWTATLAAVSAAKSADPSAPYAHNNEFWRVLGRLSTEISVAIEAPTWTDIAKDTIENYPATLAHTAGQAAHGVGDALSAVGSYVVDQLKKPLIIGGVALGGLYLLTRNREER